MILSETWTSGAKVSSEELNRVAGVVEYLRRNSTGAIVEQRPATVEEAAVLREREERQQDATDATFIDAELVKALPDLKAVLLRTVRLLRRRGVLH